MTYYLLIYFIAGIFQDLLWTLNVRYVAKGHPIISSLYSFLTSMVSLTVFYNILTRLDDERSLLAITIYSLGIAFGTFLGMKLKLGKKNEK